MNAEQLRARTKQFTLRVLKVVAALPDNTYLFSEPTTVGSRLPDR